MNIYVVSDKEWDEPYYIAEETPNKAKLYYSIDNNYEYIDTRYCTKLKNVECEVSYLSMEDIEKFNLPIREEY